MRIHSIDALRIWAALAVVILHVTPFGGGSLSNLTYAAAVSDWIGFLCRWAIPFFFAISGYFFYEKLIASDDKASVLKRHVMRIGKIFVLWNILYAFKPYNFAATAMQDGIVEGLIKRAYWNYLEVINLPWIVWLLRGSSFFLWFFPSLILGLFFVYCVTRYRVWKMGLCLSLIAYLGIGLFAHRVGVFAVSLENFYAYAGSAFGIPYVFLGAAMSRYRDRLNPAIALKALLVSSLAVLAEWRLLFPEDGKAETLFAWLPFTAAFVGSLISRPALFKGSLAERLAPYALGVYVLHMVWVKVFYFSRPNVFPVVEEILLPLFIFAVSLVSVRLLFMSRFTRWMVA